MVQWQKWFSFCTSCVAAWSCLVVVGHCHCYGGGGRFLKKHVR